MENGKGTLEERLADLKIDSIIIREGVFSLQGPYTDSFRGKTLLSAIEQAESALYIKR